MEIDKAAYETSARAVTVILETIDGLIKDCREVWPAIVPHVFESIDRNFQAEGRPGWTPLAPRTIREREAAGFSGAGPILFRTGELRREATGQGNQVSWISKPTELRFFGDATFEKFRNHFGFTMHGRIQVPGRAFFNLQDDDAGPIVLEMAGVFAKKIQASVKSSV